MANKTGFQIVGRYMNGKEVEAYHIQSLESGKSMKVNKNVLAYLVGKEQITNCEAQIYKDKVLYRGVGISLDSLPAKQIDGELTKTDSVGHIRKGDTTEDAMTKLMIVGTIVKGRATVGYTVKNAGGATKEISRNNVIELAQQGKIGNARVQMYQGKPLLRGLGVNLNELPCKSLDDNTDNTNVAPENTTEKKSPYNEYFEYVLEAYKGAEKVLNFKKCNPFITNSKGECKIEFTIKGDDNIKMSITSYEDGCSMAKYEEIGGNVLAANRIDKTDRQSAVSLIRWLGAKINRQGISNNTENTVKEDKIVKPSVPKKLYHATYERFIKSIKQKGLGNTTQTMYEDSIPGVVYLANEPEVAESYAECSDWIEEQDENTPGLDIVILEINVSKLDKSKIHIDKNVLLEEGEKNATWEYHGIIPWEACKIININN